ncbi:MAG: hypothetical protein A2X12_03810 [Bacteroidetes bacterium GWE2_29_8]|nr:MAG: hypothetical protein A2X12_03810 [Bacteroidetes bacterium GWE2_29_8]
MLKYFNKYCKLETAVFYNIFLSLFFITFSRILIYFFNPSLFSIKSIYDFFAIVFYGLRFDISSLFIINILYILILVQPFDVNKTLKKILTFFAFLLPNILGIIFNIIDLIYIRFTLKRTTADVFSFIGTLKNELGDLILSFIADYSLPFIIGITLIILFIVAHVYINKYAQTLKIKIKHKIILFFLISIIEIIGIRGGLQLKPITIITASKYVSIENIPMITNTPFTIIKTLNNQNLKVLKFFPENKLKKIFNTRKEGKEGSIKNYNIVIIILESFSDKYIGFENNDFENSCTHFFDSLCQNGMYFQNNYANGKKSIEALPAIISGIPSLQNVPFINSAYSTNKTESIINVLKKIGYKSAFYHGGSNGTMGFDGFTSIAGFDKYYGRNEYNNDIDFDGKWGIFDHKFYEFYAKHFINNKSPFIDVFFSLSSHHPYTIHPKYENVIPKNKTKVERAIIYADMSLRHFFNLVKKSKNFENTIFIITADHTSEEILSEKDAYSIPLLVYNKKLFCSSVSKHISQQIDIKPLILNLINYNKPYYSLGNNPLDTSINSFAVYYKSGLYNCVFKDACYKFNEDDLLINGVKSKNNEEIFKAFIQTYTSEMINNKMSLD